MINYYHLFLLVKTSTDNLNVAFVKYAVGIVGLVTRLKICD